MTPIRGSRIVWKICYFFTFIIYFSGHIIWSDVPLNTHSDIEGTFPIYAIQLRHELTLFYTIDASFGVLVTGKDLIRIGQFEFDSKKLHNQELGQKVVETPLTNMIPNAGYK